MSQTCPRCYKIVDRACQSDTESKECPNIEGEEAPGFDSPKAPEWSGFDSQECDDSTDWFDRLVRSFRRTNLSVTKRYHGFKETYCF